MAKTKKRRAPSVAEQRAARAPWGNAITGHKIVVTFVAPGSGQEGVHLACTCAWTVHLGHFPTVEDVAAAARVHQQRILIHTPLEA